MSTCDVALPPATQTEAGGAPRQDAAPAPPIELFRLTKAFGATRAVDDLSFDVHWGRVTGFLGPNGAGKSTTLRTLLGLVRPSAGEGRVLGRRYQELEAPARHVGALLETQQFHPGRTARAHLRVLAAAGGLPSDRVDTLLDTVGLADDARRRVGEYSLGMRQRLGLAAALLGHPNVLILDEPANGLDPAGIRWLRHLLRSFAEGGGTVLVSSHLLGEVAQLADEVVVINRGRLVVHTTVDELSRRASAVRVHTPERARLAAALRAEGLQAVDMGGHELSVSPATPEQVGSLAARVGIPLHGLTAETSSLEEVFFDLTDSKEEAR